jgi:hypothetical protein
MLLNKGNFRMRSLCEVVQAYGNKSTVIVILTEGCGRESRQQNSVAFK